MKLGFKNRLKVLMTGSVDDYIKSFITGDEITVGMSPELAMKYSAVNACVRVRAETFASVPMILYKKTGNGREAATDLNIYKILHDMPNGEMSPFGFKETLMTNFDVSGNVVCERLLNKKGELVGLYPYHYSKVKIDRDETTRELVYEIGGVKKLKRNQVLHVPNLSFDGITGLSPITYAASAINLGLSYETYGVNFYKNAATPSGVFEHPGELGDEAFKHLKEDLEKNYKGLKNSGTPMILEEGMKWSQTTINPIDAQLLESKYFQIEDICRIYRVPQHLVNKLDRSTNNNIEHQALEFVMYTMLPIFKRFEDNVNTQLLTPKERDAGYYIEAKIDGLLRGDSKSRAEAYSVGRLGGWLSVNDIRRLENMPEIPNGNIYIEPMNYQEAGTTNTKDTYNRLLEEIANIVEKR